VEQRHSWPLGMDLTRRLVTRFPGLTTDWLWFGRTDGMRVEIAKTLGLADVGAGLWDHENRTLPSPDGARQATP
jgi:hypothetical protein